MARKKKGQRADGTFEYKCTVGHDMTGKRIQKSFYGSTLTEAKQKAEQYKVDKALATTIGAPVTPANITFGEWAEKWLETYKKPYVTPQTYENTYRYVLYRHLLPIFGAARLSDIRAIDVQRFFTQQQKYSISIQKKMLNTMHAIFDAAIDNDLIYKNPCKKIKLASDVKRHEKIALSDDQIEQVKAAAAGNFDAVCFLLCTGLRRGELLGLMWSDIDFEHKTFTVNRSYSIIKGKGQLVPPKHGSYRTLPILSETMEILQRQKHDTLYVFPAPRARNPEDPNHFSRRLRNWFKQFPAEMQCSPHELRHSYASQLQRKGVDIYTISNLLGHKDIQVTASVYVHPDVESFREKLTTALAATSAEIQKPL